MIVVADTSPPLHLGRIGRLALLQTVVGRVTVPRTFRPSATMGGLGRWTEIEVDLPPYPVTIHIARTP